MAVRTIVDTATLAARYSDGAPTTRIFELANAKLVNMNISVEQCFMLTPLLTAATLIIKGAASSLAMNSKHIVLA